jgi:porin
MLLLFLWAWPAAAQERPSANATTGLLGGSNSDNSQVPVDVRPFQLTLPRDHLLGDWDGLRSELGALGIVPALTYLSNIAGNPAGGRSQGAAYADNIGLSLLLDLNTLAGLKGGSFLITASQRSGSSLSQKYVGNAFSIQQVYGGETFHLIDLAYRQKLFADRMEIRLGRIAAGDDFLVSPYDYLFMQNGFDGNPVGIFFDSPGMTAYPDATWGALVKVTPTDRTYVMGGMYNGDSSIRGNDHHGADFSMNGPLFAIGEAGYRRNGLAGDSEFLGNYKAGFWYDNSTFTDFKTLGYLRPVQVRRGNWGAYGLFDQVLVPFGAPHTNRGLGVFGSVLVAPDDSISQLPYFCTAGVTLRGVLASRPTDLAGFGIVYGDFSDDLDQAEEREQKRSPATNVQQDETVLELTYRLYFEKDTLFFQPDFQYVIRTGARAAINSALVLGCQLGINF